MYKNWKAVTRYNILFYFSEQFKKKKKPRKHFTPIKKKNIYFSLSLVKVISYLIKDFYVKYKNCFFCFETMTSALINISSPNFFPVLKPTNS